MGTAAHAANVESIEIRQDQPQVMTLRVVRICQIQIERTRGHLQQIAQLLPHVRIVVDDENTPVWRQYYLVLSASHRPAESPRTSPRPETFVHLSTPLSFSFPHQSTG